MIYNILTGVFGALSAAVLAVFAVKDRQLRKAYRESLIEEFTTEEETEGDKNGASD